MVKTRSPLTCWRLRNSSANVAAVLHSKNYVSDEEESGGECLADNTCYCKEGPIKPSLFERPRDCLGERVASKPKRELEGESNQKLKKYNTRNGEEQWRYGCRNKINTNKNGRACQFYDKITNEKQNIQRFKGECKDRQQINIDNIDEYERFPKFYNKNLNKTEKEEHQQKNNEEMNKSSEEQLGLCLHNLNEDDDDSYRFETYRKESPVQTVYRNSNPANSSSRLEEIENFRKKHFFETHSVEDLTKTIPDHTCVHRFELDNRFLPKPLNCDDFGTSRCIICNKPMEEAKIPQHRSSTEIFPKFYKYGLAPRKVYIGCGNIKLEVVGEESESLLRRARAKRPNYHDTYALRYQRGVNF